MSRKWSVVVAVLCWLFPAVLMAAELSAGQCDQESTALSKRIHQLELGMQYRENTIKTQQQLATEAAKTSGYSKIAWMAAASPVSLGGGLLTSVGPAVLLANLIDTSGLSGLSTEAVLYFSKVAAIFAADILANYEIGSHAVKNLKGSDVVSDEPIRLDRAKAQSNAGDLAALSASPKEQIEHLNRYRNELAQMENSVFEHELNGSAWHSIEDHLLAGKVAADGTLKLLQITKMNQLVDQAELDLLKKIQNSGAQLENGHVRDVSACMGFYVKRIGAATNPSLSGAVPVSIAAEKVKSLPEFRVNEGSQPRESNASAAR